MYGTCKLNADCGLQDSSRGSLEEQPGSDDSLCRMGSSGGEVKSVLSGSCSTDAATQLDALYAEVDLSKKRHQRSTSGGLGLSGPVNSMMQQRFPENRLSLSGLTRSARDSRVDSGSVDMETPLSMSPKSPLAHLEISEGGEPGKKPIPPPRTRIPRKDSDNSVNSSFSDSASKSCSGSGLDGVPSGGGLIGGVAALPAKGQCPSASTLSGLSDVEAETYHNGTTSALGELGQAIDQAIASMTAAAAAEHADYDVPKPPRSLRVMTRLLSSYFVFQTQMTV